MGFQSYIPKAFNVGTRIEEGHAHINTSGYLTCRAADLAGYGIKDAAHVLFDDGSGRVAIRKPRDGELTVAVRPAGTKAKPRLSVARIGLAGAIRAAGMKPSECAGHYELSVKDDLVIVNLVRNSAVRRPGTGNGAERSKSAARTAAAS